MGMLGIVRLLAIGLVVSSDVAAPEAAAAPIGGSPSPAPAPSTSSTSSTSTTTTTTTLGLIAETEQEINWWFTITTYIVDSIFMLTCCGICCGGLFGAISFRESICPNFQLRPGRLLRWRDCLLCMERTPCLSAIFKKLGYSNMTLPNYILNVHLIGCYDIPVDGQVYVQASNSDEMAGHSEMAKNSRNYPVQNGRVDLQDEVLKFDWYGDEDGFHFHLRHYSYTQKQDGHAVLGKIYITREQIEKYWQEARVPAGLGGVRNNVADHGARSFNLKASNFVDPRAQDPIMTAINPPKPVLLTPEEKLAHLEWENENLKRQLRGEEILPDPVEEARKNQGPSPQLVLKFEIQQFDFKPVANNTCIYRSASFDPEHDAEGGYHAVEQAQMSQPGPLQTNPMGQMQMAYDANVAANQMQHQYQQLQGRN